MTTYPLTGEAIVLACTSVAHKLGGYPDGRIQRGCDWDALARMTTDERGLPRPGLDVVFDTDGDDARLTVVIADLGVAFEAWRPGGAVAT